MRKVVLDASVLIKFFTTENESERAQSILGDYLNGEVGIIVPELAYLEVLNALRYKKDFKREWLDKVACSLSSFGFSIVYVDGALLSEAVALSLKYGLTVYDSIYLAVARLNEVVLVTADEKIIKNVSDEEFVRGLT